MDEFLRDIICDWQKWMDQHHVKLRGDPNDSGTDAAGTERSLSREHLEDESQRNG